MQRIDFFAAGRVPGGDEVARGHIMVAVMAHALRDGEVVVMGANSMLSLAAARLARLTHAPNLTILAGASGGVNTLVEPLVPSSGDYANLVAEAVLPFSDVLALWMGGRTDVFFAGGLQIDRRGNCNLALVGPRHRPVVRGPGSAGLPWAHNTGRTILFTTSHSSRVFVPRVDFVSMAGWPEQGQSQHGGRGRKRAGRAGTNTDAGGKPVLVVTPLAVMDFTDEGLMRLVSVHPGGTVEQVTAGTGFELIVPADGVPTTPLPDEAELQHLRMMDPDGLLAMAV